MTRAWRLVGLLLFSSACAGVDVELEGLACSPEHPCPQGIRCNRYLWQCTEVEGCPALAAPERRCSSRNLYLAPEGDDGSPGTEPSQPRRTLEGILLAPGDHVHFGPGLFGALRGAGSGTADCPVLLSGAPEGGTRFTEASVVGGSYWHLKDLEFEVPSAYVALTVDQGLRGVVLERLRFQHTAETLPDPNGAKDLWFIGDGCLSCSVLESEFRSAAAEPFFSNRVSSSVVFRGNRVYSSPVRIEGETPLVEGNLFTEAGGTLVALLDATGGGAVTRNIFRDTLPGARGVEGAVRVLHNTFLRMPGSSVAAHGAAIFEGNAVLHVETGLQGTPERAGHNLFDGVRVPYSSGAGVGDLSAPAQLDGDLVPLPSSPAVDRGPTASPVPPGGGARADIGARELGATLLTDGRYCIAL